ERIAGGYQLLTKPEFAGWLRRLNNQSQSHGLSSPALETLAVVAYQQPILRAEVESVRGVSCGELLRQLMDRNLVRISGRSEELGRPFLYSTTRQFLSMFGLNSLDDLPQSEALVDAASDDHVDPIVVESEPRTVANPSQENEEVTLTEWHQDGVEEIDDTEDGSQSVVMEIEDEENYAYADDDDDEEEDGLPADGFDGLDNNFDDDADDDDDDYDDDDSEENEWQEVEGDDDEEDDEYDDEWSDDDDVEWTDDDDDDDDDDWD
ncbi:MAG: SMC-Scp complex subunit ScpB, partial [Planctomycetota bacterium]|nr:SMC-Scp complex subunit ScpB [Planctomycetota bacterium]